MRTGQTGIFALGDAAHAFVEFEIRDGASPGAFVSAVADLRPPHTTVGGINLVAGFRPELWRNVAPDDAPGGLTGFDAPIVGPDGFTMPATQADAWVWLAASSYDIVFDATTSMLAALTPFATLTRETRGWSYRHSRDLTGFEDGTENPSLLEAPDVALVPEREPGGGGSVLLFQLWRHDNRFHALRQDEQEAVIGRTKDESIELDEDTMPPDAHVARTKVVVDGEELQIFRRNMPYGTVTEHGTIFIGFSRERDRMHRMLEQMAGRDGGPRDALTRYTTPLTGAYYFVPSVQSLRRFASDEHEEKGPLLQTSD